MPAVTDPAPTRTQEMPRPSVAWPDTFGRARRSAAIVLALAVLTGSGGVVASATAALHSTWPLTFTLLAALPLCVGLAVAAWCWAFRRPTGVTGGRGCAPIRRGSADRLSRIP
jgi:protein-S-isoprenylcysteine O-methyltransferase Ste14